jgi:hypothetical protein
VEDLVVSATAALEAAEEEADGLVIQIKSVALIHLIFQIESLNKFCTNATKKEFAIQDQVNMLVILHLE